MKKIFIRSLALFMCVMFCMPAGLVTAFAADDMSEWTITATISLNGTVSDSNSITFTSFTDKTVYQLNYNKAVGETDYDIGELTLYIPSVLDKIACEEESHHATISYDTNTWQPLNGDEPYNSSECRYELTNKVKIQKTEHLNGFLQITDKSTYIDASKSTTQSASLSYGKSAISSNSVSANANIAKTEYTCHLPSSKFVYFAGSSNKYAMASIVVTAKESGLLTGNRIFAVPSNSNIQIYDYTKFIDADDRSESQLTSTIEDGKYFCDSMTFGVITLSGRGNGTMRLLFKIPDTITTKTTVSFDLYTIYCYCYNSSDHEFGSYVKIGSFSVTIDPTQYSFGNITADLAYETGLNTDSNYDSSKYQINGDAAKYSASVNKQVSFLMQSGSLDLTDKKVILAFDGLSQVNSSGSKEKLSDSSYCINDISLVINDINGNRYSSDSGVKCNIYVRYADETEYTFLGEYTPLDTHTIISKSITPKNVVGYKVEITGLTNGIGYSTLPTGITLTNATDIQSSTELYVMGSADILSGTNSIITKNKSYDTLNCSSVSNERSVYSYLRYYVLSPEYNLTFSASGRDYYNEKNKTVTGQYATLAIENNNSSSSYFPLKQFNLKITCDVGLDDISIGATDGMKATILNTEIDNNKQILTVVVAPKTGEYVYSDGEFNVNVLYTISSENLLEFGPKQEFEFEVTDFKVAGANYSSDTPNTGYASCTITCSFPISAEEAAEVFAAGEGSYTTESTKVADDGSYNYKLRLCTTEEVTDTVMYCDIENAFGSKGHWQGSLQSIDTSNATFRGYTLKPYYSTQTQSVFATATDGTESVVTKELTDENISNGTWTEITSDTDYSKIKALAFKVLNSDGTVATLPSATCLYVILEMQAPSDYKNLKTSAYNKFNVVWKPTSSTSSDPVSLISNTAEVYVTLSSSNNDIDVDKLPETGSLEIVGLGFAVLLLSASYVYFKRKSKITE